MTPLLAATAPMLPLYLLAAASVLVLAVWLYLLLFHHRFWTTRIPPTGPAVADFLQQKPSAGATSEQCSTEQYGSVQPATPPSDLPAVLVVIPARNEAEVIARTVSDVLLQDYSGSLHLVVVNDNSQDTTAATAAAAAGTALAALPPQRAALRRFDIINGAPLPADWSGKLWAVEQGVRHGLGESYATANAGTGNALNLQRSTNRHNENISSNTTSTAQAATAACTAQVAALPQFVWLTDADISHRPHVLCELLARALGDRRAMVSRMALLCTDTRAERWTIPAFVYFFQMLYPFAAIASERSPIDGAAGGCILLQREYLQKIGGIGSLRGALIDDCTLAAHVARAGGRLWLELTKDSVSQRGYGGAEGVSNMIARTAYTQLHYSPLRLAGTVFGLIFTFFCPLLLPLAAIALLLSSSTATPAALLPAGIAIAAPLIAAAVMFGTFIPMLRFYKLNPLRALALPLVASFYLSATIKSAVRHYRGKTGNWKGRVYQNG